MLFRILLVPYIELKHLKKRPGLVEHKLLTDESVYPPIDLVLVIVFAPPLFIDFRSGLLKMSPMLIRGAINY